MGRFRATFVRVFPRSFVVLTLATLATYARAEFPPDIPVRAPAEQTAFVRLWLQGGAVDNWDGRSGAFGIGAGVGYRWRWLTVGAAVDGTSLGGYNDASVLALAGSSILLAPKERLSALGVAGWHHASVNDEHRVPNPGAATLPFAGLRIALDGARAPDRSLGNSVFVQVARDLHGRTGALGQRWRGTSLLLGIGLGLWD